MEGPADPLSSRDVAAFVAAVEAGTVQDAANLLMLTQSAATKRIQSLERTLGVELLDRTRQGVRPTAAGRALYNDAKEALAALRRGEQRVRRGASRYDLTLTIAASHTIGGFLLPAWLAAFRATAPTVEPHVEVVNSPAVLARVRAHQAQVGFVEGTDDLSAFDSLAIARDEIAVVVAAGHRWTERASVPARELAEEPFYSREAGSGTLAVARQRLAAHGIVLHPVLRIASTPSLKRAVLDGGFTLLSRRTIEDELANGALVALPVEGVDMTRELLAVRLRSGQRPRAAETFWAWLRELDAPAPEGPSDTPHLGVNNRAG